ncbi:FHA domain-containing protein FhaB/FipA [Corynebacterium heidelbergense]|uniref:FHA domain-containing protein n=1 Tax=Corynebacterium heidelbergense TaxID=2055947 RepID=A0A364V6V7_9CORY|nr:FHA domain-containing protein [Corynebacterium heidelbergense]RAV32286.1 FHA domain-containing protein [Corynebacterium heidelbergense]
MQTTLLLVAKVGLLVVLWFFIWMAIRGLNKDARRASAGMASAGMSPYASGAALGPTTAAAGGPRGLRRSRAPQALTVISGPLAGTQLDFEGYSEILIGRSPNCTLVVDDDFASGTHARLIRRGPEWYVEDLDSRNGTWIGNQRLDQPEQLAAGSEIRIGQTHLRMDA